MTKHTGSDTQRPEFAAFVASIPKDAEIERLAAEYEALDTRLRSLQDSRQDTQERLRAIDEQLLEADSKQRHALFVDRAALLAEQGALPSMRGEIVRRHTLARLAYLARLGALAQAEHDHLELVQLGLNKPVVMPSRPCPDRST